MQPSRFVVRRQNWRPFQNCHVRLPGFVPVDVFINKVDASAECQRLTLETWQRINPFRFGDSFNDVLTFPVPVFSDWLNEHSFLPPAIDSSREDWANWWVEQSRHGNDDELSGIIAGFGKLKLFDVVEVPTLRAYAIGNFEWGEDNDYRIRTGESNSTSDVYLDRAIAEERCDGENRQFHDVATDNYIYRPVDLLSIWSHRQPFASISFDSDWETRRSSMISCECYDVPCHAEQLKAGSRVFAVERMAMCLMGEPYFHSNGGQLVAIYEHKHAAENAAWEMDVRERPFLNPFRYFGELHAISSLTVSGLQGMLDEVTVRMPSQIADTLRGTGTGMQELTTWWSEVSPWLSYEQRNQVWDLLDQLRFYRVREVTLR